jgi:hypothetical protein
MPRLTAGSSPIFSAGLARLLLLICFLGQLSRAQELSDIFQLGHPGFFRESAIRRLDFSLAALGPETAALTQNQRRDVLDCLKKIERFEWPSGRREFWISVTRFGTPSAELRLFCWPPSLGRALDWVVSSQGAHLRSVGASQVAPLLSEGSLNPASLSLEDRRWANNMYVEFGDPLRSYFLGPDQRPRPVFP